MLTEKDAQNITEMETLQQQLAELLEDGRKREEAPKQDKSQVKGGSAAGCWCAGAVVVHPRLFCVSWQRVCLLWRRS